MFSFCCLREFELPWQMKLESWEHKNRAPNLTAGTFSPTPLCPAVRLLQAQMSQTKKYQTKAVFDATDGSYRPVPVCITQTKSLGFWPQPLSGKRVW